MRSRATVKPVVVSSPDWSTNRKGRVKNTMGRFILVGLLAFAVALSGSAYAAVQNVKVSGDVDMKAISHHNYDLKLKQKNEPGPGTTGGTIPLVSNNDDESFYLSTVHVGVDADLTDNVSTHVRLVNQRKWDTDIAATSDINIDNAYVVLKEFLYSPLTVMVGKQDLNYGTGFIVGAGLLGDPDAVFASTASTTQLTGNEYSAYNAYDAIRLILDFSPWTIEGLVAKINETGVIKNDQDLYGVYVTYKTPDFAWWKNGVVEPYWFYKQDEAAAIVVSDSRATGTAARTYDNNRVNTFGARVAGSPIEHLMVNGELAFQIGDMSDVTGATEVRERKRFGIGSNVDVRYNWAHVPWTPATGVGWIYFSGERNGDEASGVAGVSRVDDGATFNAWDAMYRGSFATYIQDFFGGNDEGGLYTTFDTNDTSAATNRHLIYGDVSVKPMDDVTLWARYTHVRFAQAPRRGRSTYAGDEVDVKAVYDYTEDVQLAAFGGWFFPGAYYDQPQSSIRGNDLAWTVGGSAVVKF